MVHPFIIHKNANKNVLEAFRRDFRKMKTTEEEYENIDMKDRNKQRVSSSLSTERVIQYLTEKILPRRRKVVYTIN